MDMRPIKSRMEELGLDLAALNRRYCDLKQSEGDLKATPVNRRSMLKRILDEKTDPSLQTLIDLLKVLGGTLDITWVDTKRVTIGGAEKDD